MTEPFKLIRAFFAISLPCEVSLAIEQLISTLKKQDKHPIIRWVKPHHLHVTLQFLEKISAADVQKLTDHVGAKIQLIKPFYLKLGPLELFPTPHHPKIISLNVEPQAELKALAQQIGLGIEATNYPIEKRSFRAHLTLGRFNTSLKHYVLPDLVLPVFNAILVKEVILFQSEPQVGGSVYIPITTFSLIK